MERWAATVEAMARDKATKDIMFGRRRLEISGSDSVLFFSTHAMLYIPYACGVRH
jgi:hypothetical protein